jgi:hypothetical protein
MAINSDDEEEDDLTPSACEEDKERKQTLKLMFWIGWLLFGTLLLFYLSSFVSEYARIVHAMPTSLVIETAFQSKVRVWDRNLNVVPPTKKAVLLAGVTLVLNKGRYLLEWIVFHKLMGFDLFLIFDHGSTDNTSAELKPFIAEGSVIMVHAIETFPALCNQTELGSTKHKQAACQIEVFNYALRKMHTTAKWITNFDVDEFLWTPANSSRLPELLTSYFSEYDNIHIHGITFGNNDFEDTESHAEALVIEQYTKRASLAGVKWSLYDEDRYSRKTLFRPSAAMYVFVHSITSWTWRETLMPLLSPHLRLNHNRSIFML